MNEPTVLQIEAFCSYINEREAIRIRKEAGEPFPWTQDKILQENKFTNVKRLNDKTTQHLKQNYYDLNRSSPWDMILLNCATYRYFGTSEFADAIGWLSKWDPEYVYNVADDRLKKKQRVFTGAYVITNQGIRAPKHEVVVHKFLTNFAGRAGEYARIARETQSWRLVYEELRKLEGFGGSGFMAKEILQDAILTPVLENATDRLTWSPVGLGARRGLNRIWGRDIDYTQKEATFIHELGQLRGILYGHDLGLLKEYVPELDLHDVQFCLCEFDKYERMRLGQGRMRSKYKPPIQKRGFLDETS